MKANRFFKINFILILILLFQACEDDLLKKYPMDAPASENFYSSEKELIMAVNGAYNNLIEISAWWGAAWFRGRMFPWHLDAMSDIGWQRYGIDIAMGNHDAQSTWPRIVWDNCYNGIAKCNKLLNNMHKAKDKMNEDLYNRIKAEARFLRAYQYHHLVELYGDVPLLTELPSLEEADVSRTDKTEVVNFILEELEAAASDLPTEYNSSELGRATKGAALTYKARTALYHEKWSIAIDAAQRVMDLGVYSLYPNYRDLFTYDGENCDEIILDYKFKKPTNFHSYPVDLGCDNAIAGTWAVPVPLQDLIDSYEATDGKPIDESSVYDQSHPFQNRDPRLDQSIIRDGMKFGNWLIYTHPDSTETWQYENGDSIRVENENVTSAYASFSGWHWKKYLTEKDLKDNPYESEINLILARYPEVLLTYAEAKIESNDIDQSVLDAINKVRSRPSVEMPAVTTTNQEELRRIVRRERKVELAFEGFRYYDIRRWGIAEEAMNRPAYGRPKGSFDIIEIPEIDENGIPHYNNPDKLRNIAPRTFDPNRDYLWPIPQSEMDVNPNLEQNPGY